MLTIRPILPEDNQQIAKVIREALEDFKANKPGTAYFDSSTDNLFDCFKKENSAYFIALLNGKIVGGCGIYPTKNLPNGYVELVKIYIHKSSRGKGIGKALMNRCFDEALKFGYKNIYLESMPELNIAIGMYEKMGFAFLEKPLGSSGHFGCNLWMKKEL